MAECRITGLTDENLEQIVKLGRKFVEESPVYSRMEYDPVRTRRFLKTYQEPYADEYVSGMGKAFVAMIDDQCAGFLFVSAYHHPCLSGVITSDDLMYVHPVGRGLGIGGMMVEMYKEWAAAMGADVVLLGSSSGINEDFAKKFYSRHGFEQMGVLTRWTDVRRED